MRGVKNGRRMLDPFQKGNASGRVLLSWVLAEEGGVEEKIQEGQVIPWQVMRSANLPSQLG
jgi:hypothetical protein